MMLWDDFINSYWRDWRTGDKSKDRDRLEDPQWVESWLSAHGLPALPMPDSEQLDELKELRGYLFDTVREVVEGKEPAGLPEKMNHYMAAGPVMRQAARDDDGRIKVSLMPLQANWEQVMAEIAASFASALAEKEQSRFRICDNPDCLWVYYDDTRNRSKRYCDDKACGNLMKVRRFRARKKAEQ
ncbi:CGNR zinc finger domain-containing protein [Paenibacillus durus]|nr:CGNR zinc finger domain-containing protein [Paenibacillus durus]